MSEVRRYTDYQGNEVAIGPSDSYILYVEGDTGLKISLTSGGYHPIWFPNQAARDRELKALARDHNVWKNNIQINPRGENYGKHIDEILKRK